MPQLLIANGRRSEGRQAASAASAVASGMNANKRGSAGLVFEKSELRPTSLLHFLASSSLIAAARAPMAFCCCESLHLLRVDAIAGGHPRVDSALVCVAK